MAKDLPNPYEACCFIARRDQVHREPSHGESSYCFEGAVRFG